MATRITTVHLTLAITVVGIWGANFIVMKWGLNRLPPLTFCTWRFLLSFFPACLFLPAPRGHWRLLIAFGTLTGLGQFGLLCLAMQSLISPGLASVVVQTQAFFNVGLAAVLLKEDIKGAQVMGCLVAGAGLVIIALHGGTSATGAGILLVLLAALSWAFCNVLVRRSGYDGDLVAFMVWASLFATMPLAGLALIFEGAGPLALPLSRPEPDIWLIIAWQAYANTIFGYAVWNGLIRSYTLSRIAPLTLLVPVVAMALAAVLLGEKLESWKAAAAVLILLGIAAPYAADILVRLRRLPL